MFDGVSLITVDPNLLTPEDIEVLLEDDTFELTVTLMDQKGYKSEYALKIEIEIIEPEVEEEEVANNASWTPPADFLNRINEVD